MAKYNIVRPAFEAGAVKRNLPVPMDLPKFDWEALARAKIEDEKRKGWEPVMEDVPWYTEVARLLMWGYTALQVAETMGVDRKIVDNVRKMPWFITYQTDLLHELNKQVAAEYAASTRRVIDVVGDHKIACAEELVRLARDAVSEAVRKAACETVLKIGGELTPEQTTSVSITLNADVLENLKMLRAQSERDASQELSTDRLVRPAPSGTATREATDAGEEPTI